MTHKKKKNLEIFFFQFWTFYERSEQPPECKKTLSDARCRLRKVQSNTEINPCFFKYFFVEFIDLDIFSNRSLRGKLSE